MTTNKGSILWKAYEQLEAEEENSVDMYLSEKDDEEEKLKEKFLSE